MIDADYFLVKVKEFRDACGIKQVSDRLHFELFMEEFEEIWAAKIDMDLAMVADGYADCVFIMAGWHLDGNPPISFSEWLKMHADKAFDDNIIIKEAFDIVYESNMSKICKSSDIVPTSNRYLDIDIELEWRKVGDDRYAGYIASETDHGPIGKLIKPVSYFAPNWDDTDSWMVDSDLQSIPF